MAQQFAEKFTKDSALKSFDGQHRELMRASTERYKASIKEGTSKFFDLQNTKKKANLIKWKTNENLDRYLLDFEANFTRRGGKIIWANDATEACEEIARILEFHQASTILKTKSAAYDEIELGLFLEKRGVETVETDMADIILQLAKQKPYSFAKPALQFTFNDIARLFHDKYETDQDATPEQLVMKSRELLRDKYTQIEVSLTGADFLLADTGSVVISENAGNGRLSTTFPKVHIAIAGIESIIPNMLDLDLFWPLLASHSTGQQLMAYNSILTGPRQPHETDGPEEMYVVLLDNGRTNLLAEKEQRQGLYCVQCGACLQVCPVYQTIGGHSYQTTYQGPIGSLISPYTRSMKDFKHLSFASPLSGEATAACPVGIDFEKIILLNRKDSVTQGMVSTSEKRAWRGFAYLMQRRGLLDFFGAKAKNFIFRSFFKKIWGTQRALPKLADKSFSKQWREQEKRKDQ